MTISHLETIGVADAAVQLCVSRQRVNKLLAEGRIQGAVRVGSRGAWHIPSPVVVIPPANRSRIGRTQYRTPRRRRELYFLYKGYYGGELSVAQIASQFGVDERTVYRWMRFIRNEIAHSWMWEE